MYLDDEPMNREIHSQPDNNNGINTSVEAAANEEDIYGDLESSIFTSKRSKSKNANEKRTEDKLKKVLEKQVKLKEEVKRLSKENKAYATNISSLYLTAKTEVEKKNFIIKQLQAKLMGFTSSRAQKSSMPKSEIQDILKKCQEAHDEAHSQVIFREIKKTVEQIKAAKVAKPKTNKKLYKFGNMSLFLCREQIPFKRSEPVEFQKSSPS